MSGRLIGLASPESLMVQAALAYFVGSIFIIIATGWRFKPLPNEDPATLGALEAHERQGLRDFFFHQSNSGNLLKLKQALNLQTFLDTVVSEKS
jgi:hypothetical protein